MDSQFKLTAAARPLIAGAAARPLIAGAATAAVARGHNARLERAKAEADADEAAVPGRVGSTWRDQIDDVTAQYSGHISPDLSRQEARKLERTIAKITAHQAKRNARRDKKLERKAERAGLRDNAAR